MPEQPDITPYASVGSVLKFVCRLRNEPWSVAEALLQELQLADEANRSVRELSKGQRHRVLLAAARIGTPRVVLLDEPLSALDRGLRQRTVEWVGEIRDAGGAVLIITHELEPFVELATRAVALKKGVAQVVETLPAAPAQRLELLNQLATG